MKKTEIIFSVFLAMKTTAFSICGDWATALKERPDVEVTIELLLNGEVVTLLIEAGTDVLGAYDAANKTERDPIAFPDLADMLGLDFA